jgi:hypothetical protein
VLNYKKPALWMAITSFLIVFALGFGLAANPKTDRGFKMSGNHLSDLQPEEVVGNIAATYLTEDQAVALALTSSSNHYREGECFAEGHIILGTEKKRGATKIYALTMTGQYGFQNDNFVKVSGTGVIPAVVTIR